MSRATAEQSSGAPASPEREVVQRIEDALAGLRFGAVEVTVHDGRIVQIERREKYRFEHRNR